MDGTAHARRVIRAQQRSWAESRGIELDDDGLVGEAAANLLAPLSAETERQLSQDPTRPLGEPGKPGALLRVDSTCALLCNVFDHWRDRQLGVMAGLCGADPRSTALHFRPELAGGARRPDLLLAPGDGDNGARPTAVIASFCEPYGDVDRSPPSSPEDDPGRWGGLPGCAHLARDLRNNPDRFHTLAVGGIVDCAAALHQRFGARGFRLLYLWYPVEGAAADRHREELDRLRLRIGGEIDFEVRSWQGLFASLQSRYREDTGYAAYLAARYFPETRS